MSESNLPSTSALSIPADIEAAEKGISGEVSEHLHTVSGLIRGRWQRIQENFIKPTTECWLRSIDSHPIICTIMTVAVALIVTPTLASLSLIAFTVALLAATVGTGVALAVFGIIFSLAIVLGSLFFAVCILSTLMTLSIISVKFILNIPRNIVSSVTGNKGPIQLPDSPSIPLPNQARNFQPFEEPSVGTVIIRNAVHISQGAAEIVRGSGSGVRYLIYASASGIANWAAANPADESSQEQGVIRLHDGDVLWQSAPTSPLLLSQSRVTVDGDLAGPPEIAQVVEREGSISPVLSYASAPPATTK